MKPDRQVIKQVTLTLKHLAKDLRNCQEVEAAKVSAYSKLLSDYNDLIKLAQGDEAESNNFYDRMEAEALRDAHSHR